MKKITLSLNPDQADAFAASLDYYYAGADRKEQTDTFLYSCVDALIAAAANGESVIAPLQLVRC